MIAVIYIITEYIQIVTVVVTKFFTVRSVGIHNVNRIFVGCVAVIQLAVIIVKKR